MDDLLRSALLIIDRYPFVIYTVGGVGVLLYLLRAREANRVRRYSPFPIEREEAAMMLRDALIILGIFLAIIITTFYIDQILLAQGGPTVPPPSVTLPTVTPTSPAIGLQPSPAPTQRRSPTSPTPIPDPPTATTLPTETALPVTPTPTSSLPTVTAAATAIPIPTQPALPTATQRPSVPPASCNTPGVRISAPAHGEVVSGNVRIVGSADIERFQFYKVEFGQGASPGSFAVIGDVVRQPVQGGLLATWPSHNFSAGVWTLRLTAVDETGNFPPPCDIRVIVP